MGRAAQPIDLRLAAHPSRPGSMLAFVALPAFLVLLTLVSVPVRLFPVQPYIVVAGNDHGRGETPSQRVVSFAGRIDSGSGPERIRSLWALAEVTQACPDYASYTVPRMLIGLQDVDPTVRSATAAALGALGAHAVAALPSLRAVRGKGDAHADHVLAEAIWWIEHGQGTPGYGECEHLVIGSPNVPGSQRK